MSVSAHLQLNGAWAICAHPAQLCPLLRLPDTTPEVAQLMPEHIIEELFAVIDPPHLQDFHGMREWYVKDDPTLGIEHVYPYYHRDRGLPAITSARGARIWYRNGSLHRDGNLPAIDRHSDRTFKNSFFDNLRPDGRWVQILARGDYEWWVDGQLHREDGPAVLDLMFEREYWYRHGLLHRIGAPAWITNEDEDQWWEYGVRVR